MHHAFVGLTVLYRLTEADAEAVNRTRGDAPGFQAHVGARVTANEQLPMMIVRTVRDSVDGQVMLPGNDSLWVTGAQEGENPGQWEPNLHG